MNTKEIVSILVAIIITALVTSFHSLYQRDVNTLGAMFLFAAMVVIVYVGTRKISALMLDADAEHEIWMFEHTGYKPHNKFEKPIPAGVIVPLLLSLFSLGALKCLACLTYETVPLKRRVARRFGPFSYTEITDWHTALVGAGGIVGLLILAVISYLVPGFEPLPKLAIFYAFWNMIPFSKLDGAQIWYGSRPLYVALATIVAIFTVYTLIAI